MSDLHDEIVAIVYKHLPGKHSQKRHGWRYGGGVASARRSMRGEKDPKERAEYRKRAGMSEPKKVDRKPETSKRGIVEETMESFRPEIDKYIEHKVLFKKFQSQISNARNNNPDGDYSDLVRQRNYHDTESQRMDSKIRMMTERQLRRLEKNGEFWESIHKLYKKSLDDANI